MGRTARVSAVVALSLLLLGTAARAPVAAAGGLAYAALGDSYVSGNGSGSEDGTDCRRSANAYPAQFAKASGHFALTDFAACTGATISSVERSQLGGIGPARLVSVTVGGNDARFGEIIIDCLWPRSGCRSDYP
ncbi:MAG: GDSL-type esterase/lipase family protein, partial [Candidatus Dormibacteria bacterium]